jgi:hypothetical protein
MLAARLTSAGLPLPDDARLFMLTNPRVRGHIFNPITMYYAVQPDGALIGALAEVNNTHGEQHPYPIGPFNEIAPRTRGERVLGMRRFSAEKAFYVSPWLPMDARYELSLTTPLVAPGQSLILHVDEYRGDARIFQARLWGRTVPLTPESLRAAMRRHPLMTRQVISTILYEGLRTHLKGAPFRRWKRAARGAPGSATHRTGR